MNNNSIIIATKKTNDTKHCFHFSFRKSIKWNNLGEIHINLWKLKDVQNKNEEMYSLDLGIKFFNFDNAIDSILLFVPYNINKNDIVDLGCKLQIKAMVDTLFNDTFELQTEDTKSRLRFFKSANSDIALYQIPSDNIKKIDFDSSGSLFQIKVDCKLPSSPKSRNLYVRMRLNIKGVDNKRKLRVQEELSNDFIQAVFSKSELYDIRVNDFRNVSEDVYEKIFFNLKYEPLKFQKAHMFFMTNIKDNVYNCDSSNMDVRMLEYDKWNSYISIDKKSSMLAYHWRTPRDNNPRNSYEVFFRVVSGNWNFGKFSYYALFVILLSAWGSLLIELLDFIDFSRKIILKLVILICLTVIFFVLWKLKAKKS